MARLNRKALRAHEERILKGLAEVYYEGGFESDAYRDESTGGIYEHKLAHRLGYKLAPQDRSPSEFIEACRILEGSGYVRRVKRSPDFPEFGIWPTVAGLDRAEYVNSSWLGKARLQLATRWPEILVAALTTIVTLALSNLFGWFGLGGSGS